MFFVNFSLKSSKNRESQVVSIFPSLNEIFVSMRCASTKKFFFQAVMNVLLYIVKDPKEEKGAQNRWQGKDWLLSVFFFTLK